jgi:uncharacterized membrane protein YuzA (DUF378 family)
MKVAHAVSFILLIVGGLNWGLVGVGVGNVVTRIVGEGIAQIVFVVVGLAAIFEVVTHKSTCKACVSKGSSPAAEAM